MIYWLKSGEMNMNQWTIKLLAHVRAQEMNVKRRTETIESV